MPRDVVEGQVRIKFDRVVENREQDVLKAVGDEVA